MQQDFNDQKKQMILNSIQYLLGDAEVIGNMAALPAKEPFAEEVIEFLHDVSKVLMGMREAKAYPDVITLGFWMRKASVLNLKKRFQKRDEDIHLGRGIVFHIAPSNVPVNYAYSLVAGLLTGNANIVKVPSKIFPQVEIINRAIQESLTRFQEIENYICLVRYERDKNINDCLSAMADVRIIWGGDHTIAQLRESMLAPRAGEITFADRYSLAVIDSSWYMKLEKKRQIAEDFYNDTYLTDQNACTSPRMVVWVGAQKAEAKEAFWKNLYEIVREKYDFQPIMGVNKLTSSYLAAATYSGIKIENHEDNYLVRIGVSDIPDGLMELKENSGYFFEYDCENIMELKKLCDDKRCQTIGFIGDRELLFPLLKSGIKGVDRIVPVGKTMDFDLIWDGYDLSERLTRTIRVTL